jgi:hypothetical protein
MIDALQELVEAGLDAVRAGKAQPALLEAIGLAYCGFQSDGKRDDMRPEYGWAFPLVMAIEEIVKMRSPVNKPEVLALAAQWLRLEPQLLVEAYERGKHMHVAVPGYVTRAVVQWAARVYTPAERSGAGRLALDSLVSVLMHPESLAEEIDDRIAAKTIRMWCEQHKHEAGGWYWGKRPARLR